MKTNKEAELLQIENSGWLLAYSDGDEFYIPYALHVERDDDMMIFADDDVASKEAEKIGVPFIYNMLGVPNGVYVDTEENRKIIEKALEDYPKYKIWGYEHDENNN